MAKSMNTICITGNTGDAPEIRYFDSHSEDNPACVCTVNIALNRQPYKNDAGEKVEETDWITVKAFNRLALTMAEFVKKGHKVGIVGALQSEKWDDPETGEKKSRHIIRAHDLIFLQSKPREEGPPADQDAKEAAKVGAKPKRF